MYFPVQFLWISEHRSQIRFSGSLWGSSGDEKGKAPDTDEELEDPPTYDDIVMTDSLANLPNSRSSM